MNRIRVIFDLAIPALALVGGCVLVLVALVSLFGCTTTAPGAGEIAVTRDASKVEHCKALGSVNSAPPYILPGDDLKQLKNKAVGLGADTVLITGPRIISTAGVAYRCKVTP